jgi:hypothetical protein
MTPAPMTDEQMEDEMDNYGIYSDKGVRGCFGFTQAIIAARDAQWAEMLKGQEPVGDLYDEGFRSGLEASASYREEARAYKEAYFKVVESVASMKALEPPNPIFIAAPDHTALLRLALEALEYADACLSNQLSTRTKHEYSIDWCKEIGAAIKEELGVKPAGPEANS